MKSLDETIAALKGRQKATEKLVPDPGHRYVATSVRTAASSYGACAQVLKSIDRVIRSQRISGAGTAALKTAFPRVADDLVAILDGADDLANSKDGAVAKKVGWTVLKGVAKWGSKALPVRYDDLRDLAEVISVVGDIASVRATIRERRQQAKTAADFLRWSQATALVSMAWAAEALRILDQMQGKKRRSLEERVAEVQQRMVAETSIRGLFAARA